MIDIIILKRKEIMKNLLIGLLALGTISAFAQPNDWFREGAGSVVSVIAQKPERAALKFALKENQKKFEKISVLELRNNAAFYEFSQKISSLGLSLKEMVTPQKPTLINISSDRKTVNWESDVHSKKTGHKVLTIGITCQYIPDSRPGIYRDSAEVYECLVSGIH